MKKTTKLTDKYEPNKQVTVTVTNAPVKDENAIVGYKRTVTLKVDMGTEKDELKFFSDDDIADFIGQIDVEDPQAKLL